MAPFSRSPWDFTDPPNTQRANTLGSELREFRQDVLERFNAMLGLDMTGETEVVKFARLLMTGIAASRIVGGSTSLALRNNADDANNLLVEDNGDATFRKDLSILGKIAALLTIDHNLDMLAGHAATFRSPVTLDTAQGAIKPRSLGNITGAVTIDWALGNNVYGTLTGNVTLTLTNPAPGAVYLIEAKQGGGGGFNFTYPGSVVFPDGITPSLIPTAGKTDVVVLYATQSGTYIGTMFTQNVNV